MIGIGNAINFPWCIPRCFKRTLKNVGKEIAKEKKGVIKTEGRWRILHGPDRK